MREQLFGNNPRLVTVRLLGREVRVPAGETVLRCFQYLSIETVSQGPFCWNGECGHSMFRYRLPGEGEERRGLACRTQVVAGMEITGLGPDLRRVLRPVLGDLPPRDVSFAPDS